MEENKLKILEEEIFTRLFEVAEIARFTPQEVFEYEESLKIYRDWYSITKTAVDKAKKEGIEKGRQEGLEIGRQKGLQEGHEIGLQEGRKLEVYRIARLLKSTNQDVRYIADVTGLTIEEINSIY